MRPRHISLLSLLICGTFLPSSSAFGAIDLVPNREPLLGDKLVVASRVWSGLGSISDGTIYAGREAYLAFGVRNDGQTDSGPFWARIWDDTTEEPIVVLPCDSINSTLGQIGDAYYDIPWTFSVPGWHTLILTVDSENDVVESNEGNNTYTKQVYVNSSPSAAPTPVNPPDGATGVSLTPTLQASAFSDPDVGDTHANTQWQVDASGSFASPQWDSGPDHTADTQVTVPYGKLSANTTYYWRVRYKDNYGAWSGWSPSWSFTTGSDPTNPPEATVLTFDGITTNDNPWIPQGYGGLSWSGSFCVINAAAGSNNGYETGKVSLDYVAYNGGGSPVEVSGSPFDFIGAHFTAANEIALALVIEGYRTGSRVYSQTVTVNQQYPTWIWLGYENVDRVTFAPAQGAEHWFVMDNMVIRRPPVIPSGMTVLTFDGITTNDNPWIPQGYGGLSWSGSFCVINAAAGSNNGYETGKVSLDYVAYNGGGSPVEVSGSPFDFIGAHFTAANEIALALVIEGYRTGSRVYSQTVTVNQQYPTWIWLGYENVDRVTFAPAQGAEHWFVMDNMVIRRPPVIPSGMTVLTFDGITTNDNPWIPQGYGGLSWSGSFCVINAAAGSNNGYETGKVSLDYVAYNGGGSPVEVSGSPFDFIGAHFTAANEIALGLVIEGYRTGSRVYSQTVTVNQQYPTWIWLGYENVDRVTFAPAQGAEHWFVMDNMVIRR